MAARVRPGLGNPYAEKRLLEEMRSTGALRDGKRISGGAKLTKSTQFFKELQETVQQDVRATAQAKGASKTKKRGRSGGSRFKL